jgi:hypothetical protein
MKNFNQPLYDANLGLANEYQVALKSMQNNKSDFQHNFEKISQMIEDEWKETGLNAEDKYEVTHS